jgi:hypothetical protein
MVTSSSVDDGPPGILVQHPERRQRISRGRASHGALITPMNNHLKHGVGGALL